jgi:hypothetical protein
MNDRCLSVGASNGDHRARLPTIEARRQKRQSAMWAWIDQDRNAFAAVCGET